MLLHKCAPSQVCTSSSMRLHKYASPQVCTLSSVHLHKCALSQVCISTSVHLASVHLQMVFFYSYLKATQCHFFRLGLVGLKLPTYPVLDWNSSPAGLCLHTGGIKGLSCHTLTFLKFFLLSYIFDVCQLPCFQYSFHCFNSINNILLH